ncbi:hypothetical protein TNCV_4019041 [Trichonephila clavipes]|nr:hypothetical protein TNCV_4019041 [Trichonephila clavipes]
MNLRDVIYTDQAQNALYRPIVDKTTTSCKLKNLSDYVTKIDTHQTRLDVFDLDAMLMQETVGYRLISGELSGLGNGRRNCFSEEDTLKEEGSRYTAFLGTLVRRLSNVYYPERQINGPVFVNYIYTVYEYVFEKNNAQQLFRMRPK